MFLDDKLLLICETADLSTPDKIQELNVKICNECENYYKPKLYPNMKNKEVKILLDRTFNLFDSFVRMLKKSEYKDMQLLGELFENHSFKKQLLANPDMNRIYNSL